MNVGIATQWRNQGQATLSRHLRDLLHQLGHRTWVLARPTHDEHVAPGEVARSDVWDQEGVETASGYKVPLEEYLAFAERHRLDACFFNQNYQWKAVRALRERGVRTIGYFVWESFRAADAVEARRAYDVIYSLNRCTRDRYRRIGIDSPLMRWGIHPELLAVQPERRGDGVRLFFPGGMQGPRKPLKAVVDAFARVTRADARLVLKGQVDAVHGEAVDTDHDPRVERVVEDLPTADYLRLFASCDVCLGVSRWEGTGLHFFEATAFGMPMIINDVPPMNESFEPGRNARLVKSHVVGTTRSGIPAVDPDPEDLRRAMEELCDPALRARLSRGALERRDRMPWRDTVHDFGALLEALAR